MHTEYSKRSVINEAIWSAERLRMVASIARRNSSQSETFVFVINDYSLKGRVGSTFEFHLN